MWEYSYNMIDKKYIIGLVFGFFIASLMSIDMAEAGIPPTRALQSLNITLPWFAGGSVVVEADTTEDEFIFVSDGSMYFNVTESYP